MKLVVIILNMIKFNQHNILFDFMNPEINHEEFEDEGTEKHYSSLKHAKKVELGERLIRFRERKAILDFLDLKEDDTVLDIGSNLGYLAKKINEKGNCKVIGIDVNPDDLVYKAAEERTQGQDVHFLKASGTDAPFSDKTFNKIVMSHVLEHFDDPAEVLNEVKRLLTDNGTFVVSIPKENKLGQFSKDHKQLFKDIDDVKQLLSNNQFEPTQEKEFKITRSFVVAAKPEQSPESEPRPPEPAEAQ